MNALASGQKSKLKLAQIQVQQTLPSEEELNRQIEQFIKEDYQGFKALPFRIIIVIAISIIIFGAIWHAWL